MEIIIFGISAVLGFIIGYGMGNAMAIQGEDELMTRLTQLRAERYIGAVAKVKVEEEIQNAAKAQADERLAQQGITPTKP